MKSDTMLLSPYRLGDLELRNRVVMAPLTRNRALGNLSNALMVEHYAQRADAGLIITEGTSPSADGLGYPRMPGLFAETQAQGWRSVTDAVHAKGGRIFVQLMHAGRVGHPLNLPTGGELLAPSPLAAPGQMHTDEKGPLPHPVPREMTVEDIARTVREFIGAARLAIRAGFDGVEIHAANGYLLDQFLNPRTNCRQDDYGGTPQKRARIVLEIAHGVSAEIGAKRTGIRISPYNELNGMGTFDRMENDFVDLAHELSRLGLVYLHICDLSNILGYHFPSEYKRRLREAFDGAFVSNGAFDRPRAHAVLDEGLADLVAFGRAYVANPDLVERLRIGAPLATPRYETLYTPGPEGYNDYPRLSP